MVASKSSAVLQSAGRELGKPSMLARSQRRAIGEFIPESESELHLNVGDIIVITHDPERQGASAHRWVYGKNESTQSKGWFPFSSTNDLDEPVTV